VAVTSIIAIVSLVQGMNEYVTTAVLASVGAEDFTIQRTPVIRSGADEDRVRNNPRIRVEEAAALRKGDNIGAVAAQVSSSGTLVYGTQTVDGVQIQGVSRDYIYFSTFTAELGRLISPVEVDRGRPVVVLGWDAADRQHADSIKLSPCTRSVDENAAGAR